MSDTEKPDMTDVSDGFHTFGELYEHRTALFAALIAALPRSWSWMSKLHHDGTSFEGFFIAGIELPQGQISYHIDMKHWDTFVKAEAQVSQFAPKWDGHEASDVVKRLTRWATK